MKLFFSKVLYTNEDSITIILHFMLKSQIKTLNILYSNEEISKKVKFYTVTRKLLYSNEDSFIQ